MRFYRQGVLLVSSFFIFTLQCGEVGISTRMLRVSDKGDSRVSVTLYLHSKRPMKNQFFLLASAFVLAASASAQSDNQSANPQARDFRLYNEPYRPQYHFSPPINFMNDPNELVYFKGTYHLYYQYNPTQLVAGNQAWGHAVSSDLIHWKNLPIAIPEELTGPLAGQIFTGSAVVDSMNTSGFFPAIQARHS
jgi:hypothetical protein